MTMLDARTPDAPTADAPAALPLAGDGRFTIRRLWDDRNPAYRYLHVPVRVTHTATGLYVDLERAKFSDVTPGRAISLISAKAVEVLHAHRSDLSDRAVAIMAVRDLQVISAYCHCGGYLFYAGPKDWRHVNVCEYCLHDSTECGDPAQRKHRHEGCATPGPAQCEHNCRAANVGETCGCDKWTCGNHDCDTAMVVLRSVEPMFIPAQAPAVAELAVR